MERTDDKMHEWALRPRCRQCRELLEEPNEHSVCDECREGWEFDREAVEATLDGEGDLFWEGKTLMVYGRSNELRVPKWLVEDMLNYKRFKDGETRAITASLLLHLDLLLQVRKRLDEGVSKKGAGS